MKNSLCFVPDGTKFHIDFNVSTHLLSLRENSKTVSHINFDQKPPKISSLF
jgi:hypothetical protein